MMTKIKKFVERFYKKEVQITQFPSTEYDWIINNRLGGKTTESIVNKLMERPFTSQQLCRELHIDLRTVMYHLHILKKYGYVEESKLSNVILYFPTTILLKEVM